MGNLWEARVFPLLSGARLRNLPTNSSSNVLECYFWTATPVQAETPWARRAPVSGLGSVEVSANMDDPPLGVTETQPQNASPAEGMPWLEDDEQLRGNKSESKHSRVPGGVRLIMPLE